MEARKRAANKRRKMQKLGKSRSTETDDDDDEPDEGKVSHEFQSICNSCLSISRLQMREIKLLTIGFSPLKGPSVSRNTREV